MQQARLAGAAGSETESRRRARSGEGVRVPLNWRLPQPMREILLLVTAFIALLGAGAAHGQTPVQPRAGGMIPYPAGWNLLAGFPGLGGAQTVVRGAAEPLLTWQAGDTDYEAVPASAPLVAGRGYWAYFPAPTSVTFPQQPPQLPPFSEPLPAGRFVMVDNPFATAALLGGADVVYRYDSDAGYQPTTTLRAGQGGWAYAAQGGTLTFTQPSGGQPAGSAACGGGIIDFSVANARGVEIDPKGGPPVHLVGHHVELRLLVTANVGSVRLSTSSGPLSPPEDLLSFNVFPDADGRIDVALDLPGRPDRAEADASPAAGAQPLCRLNGAVGDQAPSASRLLRLHLEP